MLKKYIYIFLISMVPLIELRGSSAGFAGDGPADSAVIYSLYHCKYASGPNYLSFCKEGAHLGELTNRSLEGSSASALKKERRAARSFRQRPEEVCLLHFLLFVGIPLPGTGAWTGTLAASILDMDFKSTVAAVMLGVLLAGMIMMIVSLAGVSIFL